MALNTAELSILLRARDDARRAMDQLSPQIREMLRAFEGIQSTLAALDKVGEQARAMQDAFAGISKLYAKPEPIVIRPEPVVLQLKAVAPKVSTAKAVISTPAVLRLDPAPTAIEDGYEVWLEQQCADKDALIAELNQEIKMLKLTAKMQWGEWDWPESYFFSDN